MTNEPSQRPALILEDFTPYRLNKAAEAISRRFSSHYRDQYGLTRPDLSLKLPKRNALRDRARSMKVRWYSCTIKVSV